MAPEIPFQATRGLEIAPVHLPVGLGSTLKPSQGQELDVVTRSTV